MQLEALERHGDQSGFTLVELAVVMLIMAVLLGGLLLPLSERVKSDRYNETEATLQEAREALLGYAVSNGMLPCPDTTAPNTPDGIADSPCAGAVEGYLPYITLGMGRNDAWTNPLRYRVDPNYTIVITNPLPAANGYLIRNLEAPPVTLATDPAAIIYSCGENGIPDDENDAAGGGNTPTCNNPGAINAIYIQDVPNEATIFDDSLVWLSKNTLMNRLVAAGQWP